MALSAGAAWLNTSFTAFDEGITLAIHKLYEACGGWLSPIMEFISLLGKGGIFLIILSLILLICRPTRRYGTAMIIGLALGAIVVNLWLKVVIARPRPYADVDSIYYPLWQMLGSHTESDFSFPSGHTNAAFASMVPVFLLGKKNWSWIALVFAVLMGISRIYLVVHFPSCIPENSRWYGWSLIKAKKKGAHE